MSQRLPLCLRIARLAHPIRTGPVAHCETPGANASRLVTMHDLVQARVDVNGLSGNNASPSDTAGSTGGSVDESAGSPNTPAHVEGVSYFTWLREGIAGEDQYESTVCNHRARPHFVGEVRRTACWSASNGMPIDTSWVGLLNCCSSRLYFFGSIGSVVFRHYFGCVLYERVRECPTFG